MSKVRFNREKLKTALLALDETSVRKVLETSLASDLAHAEACARELIESGAAVVRHPAKKKMAARDAVMTVVRAYVQGYPDVLAKLEAHLGSASDVESHYHSILASLGKLPVSQVSAADQVWACIACGVHAIRESLKQWNAEMKEQAAKGAVMIKRPSIAGDSGKPENLDGIIGAVTKGLGDILQMMGYQHGWFDAATGELVLPNPVVVDDGTRNQAQFVFMLGATWRDLQRGWQRVRYFDAPLKSGTKPLTFDNHPTPLEFEVLEFGPPPKWELFDRIAVSRLEQTMLQDAMAARQFPERAVGIRADRPIGLPAAGSFLSLDEIVAYHFLREVLFLPIEEDVDHAGGLSLKEWLRGFSCITLVCSHDGDTTGDVIYKTRQELLDGLVAVGFTPPRAEAFIRHVTFGKSARDLYDDPLVRLADGRFMIFAPAFYSPLLANIIMSRLGRFQASFSDRGKRFESAVRNEFLKAGVPAESFKYKVEGTQYDCDVAVLWDRVLFVFECKNHGISFGHVPSLQHFVQEFRYAITQVGRTMEAFGDNPEIVKQHFGANAEWDRIVGGVIYATPWAMGRLVKEADIFSFDASALARFLDDGKVGIMSPHQHAPTVAALRRHHVSLWKGEKPAAEDLLRQLEEPMQLRMEKAGRKVAAQFRQSAERRGIVCPEWVSEPITTKQTLEAMGLTPVAAAEVIASFEKFHEAARRYDESRASSKIQTPGEERSGLSQASE